MPETGFAGTARELIKYTLWADRRMLAATREVAPEHLVLDAGASHGSLLGTLAHVLGAQRLWMSRFCGAPLSRLPDASDYPDREALVSGFHELWAELEFFLASLHEDQLQAPLAWSTLAGEAREERLWLLILHLVNHSTYHRGQAVLLLRQLGYPPPSTDLVEFLKNGRGSD